MDIAVKVTYHVVSHLEFTREDAEEAVVKAITSRTSRIRVNGKVLYVTRGDTTVQKEGE